MRPNLALTLLAAFALAACAPTLATRGNILDPDTLAAIKAGSSTREDVATRLGTPTQVSTFDDKTWYYVGEKTERYSFLDPEVLERKAIAVRFDDQGTVTSVQDLDLSSAEAITPIERRTPTYGSDNTFIQQLLGNLSHPSTLKTKKEGQ